jgi:inner membrane protein involved in colicin E2 resistance
MKPSESGKAVSLIPLALVWLALIILSLFSLMLGEWVGRTANWLPAVVAVVARYFLEAYQCVPFIRRLVLGFICFAPLSLIITDTFGPEIAALLQL